MVSTPRCTIVLTRISDARGDDTRGVDGQVKAGTDLASRLGWGIGPRDTHVIVENDVSAYKRRTVTMPDGRKEKRPYRPDFWEALAMLRDGRADGLIALDLDRACRDPRDLEDLIDVVESRAVPVESVTGTLRLATTSDISMARMLVAVANKASADTSRRVADARKRQALAGEYGGGQRPFGFEADGTTIRPAEAAEIVRAAGALLTGVSLRHVMLDLRTRDVSTVTGVPWRSATLREILLRPRNAGLMTYRGEIVGTAPWPAILPESTWRAVAAILTDPARRQTPGNTPRWLGSLIYRCGVCNDGTTVRVHGVRALGGQYRCNEHAHLGRAATPVDEFVSEVITGWLARPEAAGALRTTTAEDTAEYLRLLEREAASLRELLDEQARLHARRIIDTRQLEAGSGELRTQLDAIKTRLEAGSSIDPLDGIAGNPAAPEVWAGLDLGRKRAILNALVAVTLKPARSGRRPGGGYFDYESVEFGPWYHGY